MQHLQLIGIGLQNAGVNTSRRCSIALLLGLVKAAGEVGARLVKQQTLYPLVGKSNIQRRQVTRLGFQHNFHRRAVGIAETVIKLSIVDVVGGNKRLRFSEIATTFSTAVTAQQLQVIRQRWQLIGAGQASCGRSVLSQASTGHLLR